MFHAEVFHYTKELLRKAFPCSLTALRRSHFRALFVYLCGVFFSLIWRSHYYRWKAAHFDLCSTLMAIEPVTDTGHPFIMVISKDPWHSNLLPSVKEWSCHYLFLWPRCVADGIWTPNLPPAGRTRHRRFRTLNKIQNIYIQLKFQKIYNHYGITYPILTISSCFSF